MIHHHLGAALGCPWGSAKIVQHSRRGEVGGLHLLGQQLDAIGMKTDTAKHLHQRRFLLRLQGPFVKLPEQGQLIFPPVQRTDGQFLIPVFSRLMREVMIMEYRPSSNCGSPGILGIQIVHHQKGVPITMLLEIVQLFVIEGLPCLGSGEILFLAL